MIKNNKSRKYLLLMLAVIVTALSLIGCEGGVASTGIGASTVPLGSAGDGFVILAKTAITTTGATSINGDIGLSPAARSDLEGFSETYVVNTPSATSIYATGKIYASDMASPTPTKLTEAISDMETAYTNAAGRTKPDHTELASGSIGGLTLEPGLYKWGSSVTIDSDVTINGSATDTWIFQISGNLNLGNGFAVTLTGGALPKNIVWQVAGIAKLGTTSHMEGVILSQTQIVLETGASINGRLMAQSQVTLDAAIVQL